MRLEHPRRAHVDRRGQGPGQTNPIVVGSVEVGIVGDVEVVPPDQGLAGDGCDGGEDRSKKERREARIAAKKAPEAAEGSEG